MTEAGTGEAAPVAQRAPGRSLQSRIDGLRLLSRRHRLGTLLAVAVVTLTLGWIVGRATAPSELVDARSAVEANVQPLALDADSIWTSGLGDGPPVSDAVIALSRDGDVELIEEHRERWLEAYDSALVRMAGVDLPSPARPVQRQFMSAVTLSRDAVEILGRAARVDDPTTRQELIAEVGRLRQRSEQLAQSARASIADLEGARTDVSPLPDIPGLG